MRHGGPWEEGNGRLMLPSNGRHNTKALLPSNQEKQIHQNTDDILQEALVTVLRHRMAKELRNSNRKGGVSDNKMAVVKGKGGVAKLVHIPVAGTGYERRPNMNRWWFVLHYRNYICFIISILLTYINLYYKQLYT